MAIKKSLLDHFWSSTYKKNDQKWKPGHLENPWIKTEIVEGNRVCHYLDLSFKTFLISNFRLDRHWLRLALTATEWD